MEIFKINRLNAHNTPALPANSLTGLLSYSSNNSPGPIHHYFNHDESLQRVSYVKGLT